MKDLRKLREKIDTIDLELIRLLNDRAQVALEVGKIKDKEDQPVFAPAREFQLLQSLNKNNPGPLPYNFLRRIFREILSASRAVEKMSVIACQSSHARFAARERFGACATYQTEREVEALFEAVIDGSVDLGIVPIETPHERPVRSTIDAFLSHPIPICGQIWLEHTLHEISRFAVIGNITSPPSGSDQTLLLLHFRQPPKDLALLIESASLLLPDLIESGSGRSPTGSWLLLEASGHQDEAPFQASLPKFEALCDKLQILGSFPKDDFQNR